MNSDKKPIRFQRGEKIRYRHVDESDMSSAWHDGEYDRPNETKEALKDPIPQHWIWSYGYPRSVFVTNLRKQ